MLSQYAIVYETICQPFKRGDGPIKVNLKKPTFGYSWMIGDVAWHRCIVFQTDMKELVWQIVLFQNQW